jgi:protein SCO1
MFPFSTLRHISFFLTLSSLTFVGCGGDDGFSSLPAVGFNEIRAEVLSIDRNESRIYAVPQAAGDQVLGGLGVDLGESMEFKVEAGDFGYLFPGKVFRAQVEKVSNSDPVGRILRLSNIWPDDPLSRVRVDNINRLLRRDTLTRGDDPIRTLGEYLPPFALFDQDGVLLTTDFFVGKTTVLNFIFTRCSIAEMCPAATGRMRRLQNLVFANDLSDVQFLSVTLDPEYDVPGVLKTYALAYGIDESNFRFATASKSVIDDLVRQFGISRKSVDLSVLDHTMRTLVVNNRRQIVYQVPGKGWTADDFFDRLKGNSSNEK